MVTIQVNGTREDLETNSLEPIDIRITSGDSQGLDHPVRYEGESVFFKRDAMKEDLPYLFIFQGVKAFAIRKGDNVDFYSYE